MGTPEQLCLHLPPCVATGRGREGRTVTQLWWGQLRLLLSRTDGLAGLWGRERWVQ